MKRLSALVVLAVLLGGLNAQDKDKSTEPEDPAKADLKKFQGSWQPVKATRGGEAMKKDLDKVRFKFDKDKLSIEEEGRKADQATLSLNAKKDPKEIDISPGKDGAGQKVLGIYRLDKDQLTLCFGRPGKVRPKNFEDKEATVLVLKRAK